MNLLENEHKKSLFQYWYLVAGGLLSGVIFLLDLGDRICKDVFLKWIVMGFLAIALILICLGIWKAPVIRERLVKGLCCIGSLLLYVFFCRYYYTKSCKEEPPKASNSSTYIGQYAGATIEKTEIDNRKVYYKPFARTLSESDLKIIKDSIVSKDKRILVQYLESRTEDTLFCSQLIKALEKLEYTNVQRSPASKLVDHLSSGRLTILKTSDQDFIIINPQ